MTERMSERQKKARIAGYKNGVEQIIDETKDFIKTERIRIAKKRTKTTKGSK